MLKTDAWSDGETAALTQYWNDGVTAGDIARRLARTKNAVIGKAHRLALPPRPSPIRRSVVVRDKPLPLATGARTLPALPGGPLVLTDRALPAIPGAGPLWTYGRGGRYVRTVRGNAVLDRCVAQGVTIRGMARIFRVGIKLIRKWLGALGVLAPPVPVVAAPLALAAPAIRTAVQAKQLIPPADELPDDPAPRPVLRLGPPLPECQWPTSQVNRRGAHLLCGAPVPTRRDVYCEACAKRAYQSRRPAPLLLEGAL